MNPIYIDITIAVLLLFTVWSGYRKGFVLTLCGFLAIFVALIGAYIVSDTLAEPVSALIRPVVEEAITEYVDEALGSYSVDLPIPDLSETQFQSILDALKDSSLYNTLGDALRQAAQSGAVDLTVNAAHALSSYIAVQIARIILFILAFIVIQIGWFMLSHALDLAFKLPVLSTVNAWSGAALGLVKGLVLVIAAAWLLRDSFLPHSLVEESWLLPPILALPNLILSMISQ